MILNIILLMQMDNVKNNNMFMRRIIGLTSYFRSAQEQLMPSYTEDDYNIVEIPMSDFQFNIYEEARVQERKLKNKVKQRKNLLLEKMIYMMMVYLHIVFFHVHFVIMYFLDHILKETYA